MGNPSPRDLTDAELVSALKALADPNRFRMVQEIAAANELSCSQVNERFQLSQPTISHHLKLLVDAKVLCSRSEGKHHFFSVEAHVLSRLAELLPIRLSAQSKRRSRSPAGERP